jgi:hypothetical protein
VTVKNVFDSVLWKIACKSGFLETENIVLILVRSLWFGVIHRQQMGKKKFHTSFKLPVGIHCIRSVFWSWVGKENAGLAVMHSIYISSWQMC